MRRGLTAPAVSIERLVAVLAVPRFRRLRNLGVVRYVPAMPACHTARGGNVPLATEDEQLGKRHDQQSHASDAGSPADDIVPRTPVLPENEAQQPQPHQ